jgi:hypothetical protein
MHMTYITPTAAEAKDLADIAAKLQDCRHARRQYLLRDAQSPNASLQRCRRR